jgi:hypothetical protein
MAYHVEINAQYVHAYLTERLLPADVDRLENLLEDELANRGDLYRERLGQRVAPEAYSFWISLTFADSSDQVRTFAFCVNDEHAPMGVLRVLFVSEQ